MWKHYDKATYSMTKRFDSQHFVTCIMKLSVGVEMKKIHKNPVHSEKVVLWVFCPQIKKHWKIWHLHFQISEYYKS